MEQSPLFLRIFISSPGDVAPEREYTAQVINALPYNPTLRNRIRTRVVAWDRGGGTAMPVNLPPQEAINEGLEKPSECDIVIVILWSRMGSPLPAEYVKPNGERYLSGTEWEFYDALNAEKLPGKAYRPYVLLYRGLRDIPLNPQDEKIAARCEQILRVQGFFKTFINEDGSFRGSYKEYTTPEDFKAKVESDLKSIIGRVLADR